MRDRVESAVGRVIARISTGAKGEIRIPYAGGTEVFFAYPWEDGDVLEVGAEVVVIQRVGPRTVKVATLGDQ